MRKISTAFALAAAVSAPASVAHAEQQRIDANVGVFKVFIPTTR